MSDPATTPHPRLTPEQQSSLAMLRACLQSPGDADLRGILADALTELDPAREDRIALLRWPKGWWSLREEEEPNLEPRNLVVPPRMYVWRVIWSPRSVTVDDYQKSLTLMVASLKIGPWLPRCAAINVISDYGPPDPGICYTQAQGSTPTYLVAAEETEWQWTCMLCLRDNQQAYQLFFPGGKIMRGRG